MKTTKRIKERLSKLEARCRELRKQLRDGFVDATAYGAWHKKGNGRTVLRRLTADGQRIDCKAKLTVAQQKLAALGGEG